MTQQDNTSNYALDDLETMRRQMNALKQLLKGQRIVNETLMRNAIMKTNNRARRIVFFNLFALLFVALACYNLYRDGFMDIYLTIGTVMIMVVGLVSNTFVNWTGTNEFASLPFAVVQRKITRRRVRRRRTMLAGLPISCLWLAIYAYRMYQRTQNTNIIIICVVAFVAGAAVGLYKYIKFQGEDAELVRQLDALDNESLEGLPEA